MRRTRVFGPAYLDRVLRVETPIVGPESGGPVDQSVDGSLIPGDGLRLVDPGGGELQIEPPPEWPGPTGTIHLSRRLVPESGPWGRALRGVAWRDDLGGMGAGFAKAFDGELIWPMGLDDDAIRRTIAGMLDRAGVEHRPIAVPGKVPDWTLLVTSGGFGDKLPIGFRDLRSTAPDFEEDRDGDYDLLVAASLTNRLIDSALAARGPSVRFVAPTTRNMLDRDPPIGVLAPRIDILSCNRREWRSLEDRDEVDDRIPIVAVTEGQDGSAVRFCREDGSRGVVRVPAFPRARPPVDTNRAGEAYASTLVTALLDAGWTPGPADEGLVREAAVRASVAAALVLDHAGFGFPAPAEIDEALAAGLVA